MHERLSPSQYAFHDLKPRLDAYGLKPSYGFSPLASLSVIFRLARYTPPVGEGAPVKIIDSWHTERPSRFLTDNFGTYHLSRGGGIYPPDAMAVARLLTIVSPEMQADRRYGVPHDLNAIPSEIVAFREFAERRATSLSAEAQRLISSTKPWSVDSTEAVTGLDGIVPRPDALSRFNGELFPRPDWTLFTWSPPTARPPASVPDHLSDAPVRQAFTGGYWCTDFVFEYDGPGPMFGEENRWLLPRRWRMAGAFKSSLVGETWQGASPSPRRARGGNLAVFVNADRRSSRSRCRQLTKRCSTRWRWTEHGSNQMLSTGGFILQTKLFGQTRLTRLAT